MQSQYLNFDKEYLEAIMAVVKFGSESAPRGQKVLELDNCILTLDNPMKCISTLKPFHTRIEYAEAELAWYLSGSKLLADLKHPITGKCFQPVWEKFSDDGISVNSSYGQYLFSDYFEWFYNGALSDATPINQWDWVKKKLEEDPDTRQAVMNINQMRHKEMPTKDFPCCIAMQFTIRNDKLKLVTIFRSQDINTGLRNDVFTMTGLHRKMAEEFEMECGEFTNIALNLHIYEKDWDNARKLLLEKIA
ncbi:MAG: thymidylate synthase [Nitrosopumilus sp.]